MSDEAGRVGRGVVALRAPDQIQTSVTVVHLLIIQFLDKILIQKIPPKEKVGKGIK